MNNETQASGKEVNNLERIDTTHDDRATAQKRKKMFMALAGVVIIAGGSFWAYDALIASKHVTTDNAYVGANIAQVTPLVGGPVAEVFVEDTQMVKKGDALVRLDDTDAKLALAQAEGNLAATIRRIRGIAATDDGLAAQIAARDADTAQAEARLVAARGDVEKARIDFKRREALARDGSVSGEELTTARNALTTALANLRAAKAARALAAANKASAGSSREANRVLIADVSTDNNPEVQIARAARDQAQVNLDRTIIRAPVDGVVSRRQVQVGQRVQPGMAMMVIVPISQAYVDANFKEVQLAEVRPGQTATLTADLYGSKVTYTGRVMGFSGGTGAAFSVVPAQNATGNWIKVVQRLPVRIALDPKELEKNPLRVGLSMHVDIDVSK